MKKKTLIFMVLSVSFLACNNTEIENLKKENAALIVQLNTLKSGANAANAKPPKYILKLRLRQSHFTLSIKKHIKDAVNSVDFELPVDKDFFDSVKNGTEIIDNFRFGSFVLSGSFGDWEMTVKEKIIR